MQLNDPAGKRNRIVLYSCFSLLFIGCRLWLIYTYGNATPFWDQWDGEANNLYRAVIGHNVNAELLVRSHNEHRIFTTRLLQWWLLETNKTWNPLLQMVVNTGIQLMAVLLLNRYTQKVTGNNNLSILLAVSLVLFCMPFGWENALGGFQAQFYFALLFSIATIWYTTTYEPLAFGWWVGILFGVLAFLSLASGILAIGASALIGFIYYFFKLRKTNRQLIASVMLAGLFVSGLWLTPVIKQHAEYKANGIGELYKAAVRIFRWPLPLNIIGVVFRNLPMAVFAVYMLKKRPAASDKRWFLLTGCIWSLVMSASIAYGRATDPMSPRYKDLFLIAVFFNVVCTFVMATIYQPKYGYKQTRLALGGWLSLLTGITLLNGFYQLPADLTEKKMYSKEQEKNVRNYLGTGNMAHLLNKPYMTIPLSDPHLLASILDDRGIRKILPYNLTQPLQPEKVIPADTTTHEVQWQYNYPFRGATMRIPVTGYPLSEGIKIEIEQNGKRVPLTINANPGNAWDTITTRISDNNFTIHFTDKSAAAWAAIGAPIVAGTFDKMTNQLLAHYYLFLISGITILFCLILWTGLLKKPIQ
jgi:hypothetical protein